jgi:hypothetical protein
MTAEPHGPGPPPGMYTKEVFISGAAHPYYRNNIMSEAEILRRQPGHDGSTVCKHSAPSHLSAVADLEQQTTCFLMMVRPS